MTGVSDLADFLLARIAEDSEVHPEWGFPMNVVLHSTECMKFGAVESIDAICDCGIPARYRAECEAKRRIVELHQDVDPCDAHDPLSLARVPCATLRELAVVYADHPDYREEWRPSLMAQRRQVAETSSDLSAALISTPHDHIRIDGCYRCVYPEQEHL